MNPLKLHDVAYTFPFVALAARYDEDSGDSDKNLCDFIEDTISKWCPGSTVHRFLDPVKKDFSYAVEHDGGLGIYHLGTEGKITGAGWRSDFSPQIEAPSSKQLGGHVDFINAGERVAKHFIDLVSGYIDNFITGSHSRGVARDIAAVRYWNRQIGAFPLHCVGFCGPAVFNHVAADEYDKSGLGAVTIRPTMHHDPVDLIGLPVLRHVGNELKLPHVHSDFIKSGIGGFVAGGHAYSSIFVALLEHFKDYPAETKWLNDTKWVAEV